MNNAASAQLTLTVTATERRQLLQPLMQGAAARLPCRKVFEILANREAPTATRTATETEYVVLIFGKPDKGLTD